ncbi:MAG TPA: lipocalin family protein [Chitinophagaceae bacterium]|nr:lipocalin family protein [Chitinophagaceae bacterium]
MKTIFLMTITASMLIAATFCKSKGNKDAEKYMNKSEDTLKKNSEQNANAGSGTIPRGMENIVGEWELIKVIADRNDSHIIDADEDKDAITTVKDYLKLNANGTCEYTIAKLEGRYEIVTKEDGKKKLVMYDKTGTETTSGRYIISVTDKELVINRIRGGSDFEVFKRL